MNNPKLQTDFIREICTYFMDFLQSNFKRGRIPKRHIKLKDAKGFKVGVDASKYPDFNKALKNVVIKNFKMAKVFLSFFVFPATRCIVA
jgi:hypothetical protein